MATKPTQMARLSIDYRDYLMPSDKALKVMELMQSAVTCRRSFDGGIEEHIDVGEQPLLEVGVVKAANVRATQTKEGQAAPRRSRT